MELHGKKIKLQIWDTAGQERFHTITTSYYRGAMGIMLVYDITQEKTFDNIAKWLRNIQEVRSKSTRLQVLENKMSLNGDCAVPDLYVRRFHKGYGIFHCDLIKHKVILY